LSTDAREHRTTITVVVRVNRFTDNLRRRLSVVRAGVVTPRLVCKQLVVCTPTGRATNDLRQRSFMISAGGDEQHQGICTYFYFSFPGSKRGRKLNNCVVQELSPSEAGRCGVYNYFIDVARALYPNPKGVLRRNLIINTHYFYLVFKADCKGLFPYRRL
jgi:hypothetical protein